MKRVLTSADQSLIGRLQRFANQTAKPGAADDIRAAIALIQRLAHGELSSE